MSHRLDLVQGTALSLVWHEQGVTNIGWFNIWINRNGGSYWNQWIQASETTPVSTNRSYALPMTLPFGTYQSWIQTWNTDGSGPWSDASDFHVGKAVLTGPLLPVNGEGVILTWDADSSLDSTWFLCLD